MWRKMIISYYDTKGTVKKKKTDKKNILLIGNEQSFSDIAKGNQRSPTLQSLYNNFQMSLKLIKKKKNIFVSYVDKIPLKAVK